MNLIQNSVCKYKIVRINVAKKEAQKQSWGSGASHRAQCRDNQAVKRENQGLEGCQGCISHSFSLYIHAVIPRKVSKEAVP